MVDTRRRRRVVATSAAILCPSSPLAIAAATATTSNGAAPLTTAFACGTHWTTARTCAVLCPAGDDDACPPGQRCYGGTSCHEKGDALRHLERRAADQLSRRRDAEHVPRFVCGRSFAAAERSCGDAAAPPRYCADGSAAWCPAGAACYAAVPCPRPSRDEEPPSLPTELSSLGLLRDSSLFTELTLLNSSTPFALVEFSEEQAEVELGGSLFARESLSAMLGTASVRYGLN